MLVLLTALSFGSVAIPAPDYLQVENFQQCLMQQKTDTWTGWCLPKSQPNDCPDASWEALLNLKNPIPNC